KIFRVEGDVNVRALLKRGYDELRAAESALAGKEPVATFCPIWMKPLMTINGETFMSDMLALAGMRNVFSDRQRRYPLAADVTGAPPIEAEGRDTRYPRVTIEEVRSRNPELVLLPDEPHPFTDEDAQVFRDAGFSRVVKTSGKDLCWYGAWTIDALPRVRALVTSS
ncbi:MAG TPA: helical backbone metal receptor, partial [Labilithrix sp.]